VQSCKYFIYLWWRSSKVKGGISPKVKCSWSTGAPIIWDFLTLNDHSGWWTDCLFFQVSVLKKKQEAQAQLLRQKQKSDEASKRLQDEILRIKSHKVQWPAIRTCTQFVAEICALFFFPLESLLIVYFLQVQLQHKIKQESEQFRLWKASREKEVLQVFITE